MAELLLEFRSEEIPARMQRGAAAELARLLGAELARRGLSADSAEAFAGPRRLAAVASGVPRRRPDTREERRGPRVGAPDRAVQGFLRSAGLESLSQCERRETPKGSFWFAALERRGAPAAELLPEIVRAVAEAMPWPKSMRWGAGRFRWVRPLRGVLCIFDGAVVPGALPLGGGLDPIPFSGATAGHRWMAPAPVPVASFKEYRAKLEAACVVCDGAERARRIADGARKLAAQAGLEFRADPALLEETAGLVEWPVPLLGAIDADFMTLPPEVLATAMKTHQKYFPLYRKDGAPADRFIVVANIEAPDGGAAVRAGNERVLRARLHDARFFRDRDREAALESRAPRLDNVVFHARLGSVGDKRRRLEALAPAVARHVPGAAPEAAARAARLCKADLVTRMVVEFPELQGVMGRYYARADGEAPEVADAIAGHYAPAGAGGACPEAPLSAALALADRLDTLAGFFMIGERPTGSKDPFALRRAALGAIRIIMERRLRLPLRALAEAAAAGHGAEAPAGVAADILAFAAERLRVHMRDRGLRHDVAGAVFAVTGDDDLVRLSRRADALAAFLDTAAGADLLAAFRRAANIVRREEKRDGAAHDGPVERGALTQPAELALADGLDRAARDIAGALAGERFDDAMRALARLRGPVDRFFDEVTVNAAEPRLRANRLRLLARIREALSAVADFSKIEGARRA